MSDLESLSGRQAGTDWDGLGQTGIDWDGLGRIWMDSSPSLLCSYLDASSSSLLVVEVRSNLRQMRISSRLSLRPHRPLVNRENG